MLHTWLWRLSLNVNGTFCLFHSLVSADQLQWPVVSDKPSVQQLPIRSSDTVSHCSHLHSGLPAGSSPHCLCVQQRLTFMSLVKY